MTNLQHTIMHSLPAYRLKYFLESPSSTLPLALLFSSLFLICANWHMYRPISLCLSIVALFLTGMVLYAFINAINKRISSRRLKLIFMIFICYAVTEVLWYILNLQIKVLLPNWPLRSLVKFVLFLLLAITCYFVGIKVINTFFLVCLSIVTVNWSIHFIQDEYINNEPLELGGTSSPLLKNQPNIYMIFLESYHDIGTLKSVYNIDIKPINKFLLQSQFTIYNNVFSNSNATLISMSDTFSMQRHENAIRGNDDVTRRIRHLLAGGKGNAVLAALKVNGYHTILFTMDNPYYIWSCENNLDETDLSFSFDLLLPIRELILAKFEQSHHLTAPKNSSKFKGTILDRLKLAIHESKKSNQPLFVTFECGAVHTPGKPEYSWIKKEKWVADGVYQRCFYKSWDELSDIVTYLIAVDPNSIIILQGDHGSNRLSQIEDEVPSGDLAEMSRFLQAHSESLESWAKDRFGIMLAVRMPGGEKELYSECVDGRGRVRLGGPAGKEVGT